MRNLITATLAILICAAPRVVSAQKSVSDSLRYYRKQLQKIELDGMRQLHASETYLTAAQRLHRLQGLSRGYSAYVLYMEADGANFNGFNTAIAKDGFPPFKGALYRPGFGFSIKGQTGIVFDFNLFTIGFNKTAKYDGTTIKTSCSDLFQMNIGYAVINKKVFDLYPYAGFGYRSASLSYSAPTTTNPGANSVASLIQNDRSFTGNSFSLGYQAGLGLDFMVAHRKDWLGGTILFAKFGTDGNFGPGTYKSGGISYDAGIPYGSWAAQIGFKFFVKE